jgi:hypothetical protein
MAELLLVGAILAAGVGLLAFEYHLDRQYLARVRASWEREGSHFSPVKATRYLVYLETNFVYREKYEKGPTGVLGLSDGDIVFSDRFHDKDVRVPFEAIRWVGMREIEYHATLMENFLRGRREGTVRKCVLTVHCDLPDESGPDRWPVYAWSSARQAEFGATLAELCGLETSTEGGDFGPRDAIRLIKGSDATWQEYDQVVLYLAPDRLLLNWNDQILCSSIQRVETISTVGLNRLWPFGSPGSFRIDYSDPDGTTQTVGFQVSASEEWAEQLRSRCYASQRGKSTSEGLGRFAPPSDT